MTHVLELAAGHPPWPRRQVWGQPLQRLHVRQLVGAHGPLTSLSSLGSGAIDGAHVSDLGVSVRVGGGRQPIADAVRLQVGRFSIAALHAAAKCDR